jgi:hypothetical protein
MIVAPERCRLYRLDLERIEASVSDPALALLVASGWTVFAQLVGEEGDPAAGVPTRNYVYLVLAPPRVTASSAPASTFALVVSLVLAVAFMLAVALPWLL